MKSFFKKTLSVSILFLVVICLFAIYNNVPMVKDVIDKTIWDRISSHTLTVLKQKDLTFLATDKITTQVISEIEESNVLLGHRRGIVIATVELIYGFDLNDLTKDSIAREENTFIIKLPNPKELLFSFKPSSLRYFLDTSLNLKIYDILRHHDLRDELNKQIEDDAKQFIRSNDLLPKRNTLVNRMNQYADLLESSFSLLGFSPVHFQFQ